MDNTSRHELLGGLAALATFGGWIGLSPDETFAQDVAAPAAARTYTLPALPYPADALEPHLDAQTMTLHHGKHHAAYVDGLNAAIAGLEQMRAGGQPADLAKVRDLTDAVSFNGSGHALHSMFWATMKKNGGGEPAGQLARLIARDFGSFASFQAHLTAASVRVQGAGWGMLAWEPLSGRLLVLQAEKQQNATLFGSVPLLGCDVWEHAYYLKYQNRRADYVKAWWNVIDWNAVAARLAAAQRFTA
ncbi:MAG: superoxide dismutase [Acidobacteria bacterium]|nr:superoxide dismutase [Acidobacteriota bacterium]